MPIVGSPKVYGIDPIVGNELQVRVNCGQYSYVLSRDGGLWNHAILTRPVRNLRDAVVAIRRADAREAAKTEGEPGRLNERRGYNPGPGWNENEN